MRPDLARPMRRLAMISLHTSPLDQPGTGDAGGMNVYVIELARRLASTIENMRENIRELQEYALEDGLDLGAAGRSAFVPTPLEEQEIDDAG